MSKHTPGPWTLIDEPRNPHYRDANPEDYEHIGQHCWYIAGPGISKFVADIVTTRLNDDGDANALLIAAAPDLLAACEACEAWHLAEKHTLGTFHQRMDLCAYSEWLTKKSLAKSRGVEFTEEFEGVPRILIHLQSFTPRLERIDEDQAKQLCEDIAKATG